MTGGDPRTHTTANPILAAVYGALVALVAGYACSYLLVHLGLGIITAPENASAAGPAALSRAGLSLYAMHHVTLIGSGEVPSDVGGTEHIFAYVSLPLTVWAIVPAFALMLGGCAAAKARAGSGRWSMVAPAVLGGVLYAVVLALLSRVFHAGVSASALPAVGGSSFDPPDILFRPSARSTLIFATLFGTVFTYLGALIPLRGLHENRSGRWWTCGKALVVAAIAVQLLVAGALEAYFLKNPPAQDANAPAGSRFAEMLPTAVGIGYTLIYGSTLKAAVESEAPGMETQYRPLSSKVSLYTGMIRNDDQEQFRKPLAWYIYILLVIPAVAILVSGGLAVRWGSIDGAIPTAARIAIIHSAYLAFLMALCGIGWGSQTRMGEMQSKFAVSIAPQYDSIMLLSVPVVFILAFVGAYLAGRRRMAIHGPFRPS